MKCDSVKVSALIDLIVFPQKLSCSGCSESYLALDSWGRTKEHRFEHCPLITLEFVPQRCCTCHIRYCTISPFSHVSLSSCKIYHRLQYRRSIMRYSSFDLTWLFSRLVVTHTCVPGEEPTMFLYTCVDEMCTV